MYLHTCTVLYMVANSMLVIRALLQRLPDTRLMMEEETKGGGEKRQEQWKPRVVRVPQIREDSTASPKISDLIK